jgi:hypothetical protein
MYVQTDFHEITGETAVLAKVEETVTVRGPRLGRYQPDRYTGLISQDRGVAIGGAKY